MSPKARAETLRLRYLQKHFPINPAQQPFSPAKNPSQPRPQAQMWAAEIATTIPPKSSLRPASVERDHTVIANRIYRHFKGDYYQVLTIARHTDTNEPLVIYQLLYHKKRKIWARPYQEFLSEVDHEKYPNARQYYRFELQEVKNNPRQ